MWGWSLQITEDIKTGNKSQAKLYKALNAKAIEHQHWVLLKNAHKHLEMTSKINYCSPTVLLDRCLNSSSHISLFSILRHNPEWRNLVQDPQTWHGVAWNLLCILQAVS